MRAIGRTLRDLKSVNSGQARQAASINVVHGDRKAANANAVIVNPSLLLSICIIAFRAVVIDAGVVALLIAFRGEAAPSLSTWPIGAVVLLHPLPVVVLMDGAVTKLPVALNPLSGRRLSWLRLGALVGHLRRHGRGSR